jgi:hypothetical protein
LRIPEVFWKIIFDPTQKTALAFIVFNSPCPWNTVLLNELNKESSRCSRKYCITITSHYRLKPKLKMNNKNYDVHGLFFCCQTVQDAFDIFEKEAIFSSIKNELNLLPEEVKVAKPLISMDKRTNIMHGSGG